MQNSSSKKQFPTGQCRHQEQKNPYPPTPEHLVSRGVDRNEKAELADFLGILQEESVNWVTRVYHRENVR
jgi:hypothetical protein